MNNDTLNLTVTLVRYTDGSLNESETAGAVLAAIHAHLDQVEVAHSLANKAVNAVFDECKGKRVTSPYVLNSALTKLGITPENSKALTETVKSYLSANSGERDSGKPFGVIKGKNGGIVRWSDEPAPKPEQK